VTTLLTIAGFDPSSGAGVTADLAVFRSHGFFGVAGITALTVQSTTGVRSSHGVDATVLRNTLECLAEDFIFGGIKIGMLGCERTVLVVADFLRQCGREIPVVLDPVLKASSGSALLDDRGLAALTNELLPLVTWLTPNLVEAGALTGAEVTTKQHMVEAAESLRGRYPRLNVVVTGGHLIDETGQRLVQDLVLTAAGDTAWLDGEWIQSTATHGTGCAFSSAFLCNLVRGSSNGLSGKSAGAAAGAAAKRFVEGAIRTAPGVGRGRGPMNLDWCGKGITRP